MGVKDLIQKMEEMSKKGLDPGANGAPRSPAATSAPTASTSADANGGAEAHQHTKGSIDQMQAGPDHPPELQPASASAAAPYVPSAPAVPGPAAGPAGQPAEANGKEEEDPEKKAKKVDIFAFCMRLLTRKPSGANSLIFPTGAACAGRKGQG